MKETTMYFVIIAGFIINFIFLLTWIFSKKKSKKAFSAIMFFVLIFYNYGVTQGKFLPNYAYTNYKGETIASYARAPKITSETYFNTIEITIYTDEFYYDEIEFIMSIYDKNETILNEVNFKLQNLNKNQNYIRTYTLSDYELLKAKYTSFGYTKVKGHE